MSEFNPEYDINFGKPPQTLAGMGGAPPSNNAPPAIAAAGAAGAAGAVSRDDHTHAHGNGHTNELNHALVTQQAHGFMSSLDKTVFDGYFAAKIANTFFAGPTTGPDAAPTWRAVVLLDLPARSRQLRIQCRVTGTIVGTKYLSPGTIADGAAGDVKLMRFDEYGAGPAPSWTLKAIYVDAGTAPGGGESLVATVRKYTGGAWNDTVMVATMADAATAASTAANQQAFNDTEFPGLKLVASGGSAAANVDVTLVFERTV